MAVVLLATLAGCATFRDTPQQAYVWEKGRLCDSRVSFWKLDRVDADGRYWVNGATNAPPGSRDYLECMNEEFAKDPFAQWLTKQPPGAFK